MKTSSTTRLQKYWKHGFGLATVILFCLGTAAAQSAYTVTDLGTLTGGNFGCAMGLNLRGWTEVMDTWLDPISGNMLQRASARIAGVKVDLGTLGGPNSSINWGGINESGAAVGYAETTVPDPDGEDFCYFGTHLTCRPFLWQDGGMTVLPTLGGNNGQASAINSRGQVSGGAENTTPDSTCTGPQVFQVLPVLWERGRVQELPTVSGDPDGWAVGLNDHGQAVGGTGSCTTFLHAVLWDHGVPEDLGNLGGSFNNYAYAIDNQLHVVGQSDLPGEATSHAFLWQNGTMTDLGVLPGDFGSQASGVNEKGQVVGTSWDASGNIRGFLWENGVMTDLNILFPADSNLYATMANQINSRGEISGMATVLSGPDAGQIHAFLATPVEASGALSAEATPALRRGARQAPKVTLPENVRKLLQQRFGRWRIPPR